LSGSVAPHFFLTECGVRLQVAPENVQEASQILESLEEPDANDS